MVVPKISLVMIDFEGEITGGLAGNRGNGRISRITSELQQAPHFRAMHVNHARWRPDPVIFGHAWFLLIDAVGDGNLPFNTREIDSPLFAFIRRARVSRVFSQRFPWERDFDGPA